MVYDTSVLTYCGCFISSLPSNRRHNTQVTIHKTRDKSLDTIHETQDTRHKAQGTRHNTQGTRHTAQVSTQDTRHKTHGIRYKIQDTRNKARNTTNKIQDPNIVKRGPRLRRHIIGGSSFTSTKENLSCTRSCCVTKLWHTSL